jgi:hypothetical protein
MPAQIRFRIVVVAIAVVLGVSVRAVTNWVSADALGDVAVSFDGSVQVFDNGNVGTPETITVPALTGTNGGLAFDAGLNLLVANTAGDKLVKLAPDTHAVVSTTTTQTAPRALALAANGTIYVASAGSPSATVRRISTAGTATFSVPAESATCVGIDLSPDQKKLFIVTGGRSVKTVDNVDALPDGATPSATLYATLSGNGVACGIRLLAPTDARDNPALPTPTDLVGGVLVADDAGVKLVRPSGETAFDSGPGSKHWIDVAVDPDAGATPGAVDFWGVNAGSQPSLVKFRATGPNPQLAISLSGTPRGVAINGELRAAQTVVPVQFSNTVEATATFLQGTPYQHSWKGLNIDTVFPGTVSLAIQAIEVAHINNESPTCGPLNVDCRLTNFPAATPKTYSRGRGVVYREIWRAAVPQPPSQFPLLRIGIYFPGPTDLSAGTVCTVGGTPRSGTTILRDPWPHALFTDDLMESFYGGDDGGIIRTRTNDSIVVDRSDAQYFLRIIKPAQGTQAQLGRSMQIAVEVRDPDNNCNFVSGLNEDLVLTVTDITPQSLDKGTIIGDSRGILGTLNGNGLTWASTANQYRTNLDLDADPNPSQPPLRFVAGHKYRACVMAPAFYDPTTGLPIVGESCVDFFARN